ncbi:MAG: FtsH protease activity modulator HflK [Desulfovibrionaceae bacterium]|nr:FtsH protease activity modulator HflK [Desulfovibrionaceae bacterium]
MNWDWDKLQEKRQRQPRPPQANEDSGRQAEQPRTEENEQQHRRTIPFGGGGGGKTPGMPLRFPLPSGGRGLLWVAGLLLLVWAASGIYIVQPDEEGVVLRFGSYQRTVGSGPHYHLPFPVEQVYKLPVTRVMRAEIGFRSVGQDKNFQSGRIRMVQEEASTLTGDENIVNVQFSVQYKISNLVEYLFNVSEPRAVVRSAAEAAMREVIGKSQIDSAITDGKIKIQTEATELLQNILNRYQVGVQVLGVQLQDVHPPKEVLDAFKDVASAREDKSRIVNEAEAYRNDLLPKARGQAAEQINKAEAYRATRVQTAEGEAQRFLALLAEYEKAVDVTRKRLYYEAMEEMLTQAQEKIILPEGATDRVLPFLPLQGQTRPQAQRKEDK